MSNPTRQETGTRIRPGPLVLTSCLLLFSSRGAPGGAAQAQIRTADCTTCHAEVARQLSQSVHHRVVRCQECHGGRDIYELTFEEWRQFVREDAPQAEPASAPVEAFDHGDSFRGKAERADVPARCGTCHADVERMNPYGLRTDPLAAYWVSGHGKRLKQSGDTRVAVCIDCHGAHNVLRPDNPESPTFFQNIPKTCGRCHEDAGLMAEYNLSSTVVAEYRDSVHGQNVLEHGDAGSPNCVTCHGSHAAAPPGYLEVGHVCGQCHKQIEDYFLESVHGRIPVMARCIGCHGEGKRSNHRIKEASPPIETIEEVFDQIQKEGVGKKPPRVRFADQLDELSGSMRFDRVCQYCHGAGRKDPHARFFESTDQTALDAGRELATALRTAQYEYARTKARVDGAARGVLIVQEEALRAEDAKTELMALYASLHTLDRAQTHDRAQKIEDICNEVNTALDAKEAGLSQRRLMLLPVWGFAAVFVVIMYRKYKQLRHAYVRLPGQPAAEGTVASPGRRRLLDGVLSLMGATALIGLLWPAVAYILPARRRGGAVDRVNAGGEAGWEAWTSRKVAVGGKPVVVIRTGEGFTALSAVCTHLGCIVHWNDESRKLECPCHAAAFSADGQVISGPPPKPLPRYDVKLVQGEVVVTRAEAG